MPLKKSQPLMIELERQGSIDKPAQILQGAMREFLTHGYIRTSMDRVAAAAGVSKQTLYSHFQDKEKLFSVLVERITTQRFQMVFGSLPLQKEPELLLRQLANNLLNRIMKDQEYLAFARLVFSESGNFPKIGQLVIHNVIQPGIETLKQYLESHPELEIADPEATARIFLGSLISYIFMQELLHGKDTLPMDSDRLINSLINLIVRQKVVTYKSQESGVRSQE